MSFMILGMVDGVHISWKMFCMSITRSAVDISAADEREQRQMERRRPLVKHGWKCKC